MRGFYVLIAIPPTECKPLNLYFSIIIFSPVNIYKIFVLISLQLIFFFGTGLPYCACVIAGPPLSWLPHPHPLVCVLIAHTRPLPAVYGYAHLPMPAHFRCDSPLP